jgi:hypothetical protein
MSPAKAAAEVERITKLDQYRRGDKLTIDHLNVPRKIASRDQRPDLAPKAPVVKSGKTMGREKLEAEAKQIRLDKGYWDKSAPNFRALQARMGEIMRHLSGEA